MDGVWQTWGWGLLLIVVAAVAGAAAHSVLFALAGRMARRSEGALAGRLVAYARRPSKLILPIVALQVVLPRLQQLAGDTQAVVAVDLLGHVLALVLIGGVGWLVVSLMRVVDDFVDIRYRVDVRDNLAARRIHTQARVLRQSVTVLVVIVTASVMLMTFPAVRQLGASVLASAGLAGIVVGFAARPVLQNLIAGVQLAITQPIRVDDVLVVEDEFCRVEEITATYVVMRVWDQRRLIVPLNFFIENTFANWTRTGAEILGTVFLWVDYTVPLEPLREELRRLLEESEGWDKRVWGLQVTDANERAMQIRALMSARDAGSAWDLRCMVREKLIAFIRDNYAGGLPRVRAEVEGGDRVTRGGDGVRESGEK